MLDFNDQRPTWAEIDLDNLSYNFKSVKDFVGTGLKYMAVVKADAYGHGAVPCAKRLEADGVDWFGVALPEEGVELRKAGIRKLILCLGGFWPGQESLVLNYRLTPVVYRIELARLLNAAAESRGTVADVHIKIDTGMGRIGVRYDEVESFAQEMIPLRNLRIEGLMTHFASADKVEETEFTNLQILRFHQACEVFKRKGFKPAYFDMANSPGSVVHPESRGNMVRIGGLLYGLGGDVLPGDVPKPDLKPVMSIYSKIAFIKKIPPGETVGYGRTFETKRDTIIAGLPIGYQDGYCRSISNSGRTIINGQYAPVVGRVSMDWTLVDVTDIEGVEPGNNVVIIGQSKGLSVRAEDLAALTDTISYEITCGIHRRVPRHYLPEKP